ncbi:MAG: AAA family ATPase [Atopobiaceae bacterium]|nr:AAA family ATPase [Atopobiaceae bacterium]
MGRYVNPGNEGFKEILKSNYIDKTELISYVNESIGTTNKLICVSRPRRFGKSFAVQMLTSYYSCGCDSRALFEGLDISFDPSFEEHLNAYHVVRLDMTSVAYHANHGSIPQKAAEFIQEDIREEFPNLSIGTSLESTLAAVVESTGRQFIFVIDEWDAVFRMYKEDTSI